VRDVHRVLTFPQGEAPHDEAEPAADPLPGLIAVTEDAAEEVACYSVAAAGDGEELEPDPAPSPP
jgi:hypothetical protein